MASDLSVCGSQRNDVRRKPPTSSWDQRPIATPASAAAPSAVVSALACDLDRDVEHVGEELHEPAVRRRAAVDAEQRRAFGHRLDDVERLVRHRLERRANEVLAPRTACDPGERPRASGAQCGDPSPVSAGTK